MLGAKTQNQNWKISFCFLWNSKYMNHKGLVIPWGDDCVYSIYHYKMENSIKHNINTDLFLCSTEILDISTMHFAAKQRISLNIWKLCHELFTCKEKTVIIYVCIFLSFLSSIIAHGKPIQVLTMSYLHYNNSQMCNRCKKTFFCKASISKILA